LAIALSNSRLFLEIQDPGAIYRGSRFDWTGQVTQVVLDGKHTFCTGEIPGSSALDNMGQGLFNEFGIDAPIGYNDCPPGGQFHKPGIGLLRKKSDEPYDFFQTYEVEPAEFSIVVSDISASFITSGMNNRGYAYRMEKEISLEDNALTLAYRFLNTGELPIVTNEYVHNFLSINSQSINDGYTLRFSFPLSPGLFGENVNPEDTVHFNGNSLQWKSEPAQAYFFSNVNPENLHGAWWELSHRKEKLAIRESCNFPIHKVNIWGTRHVVSPEVFCSIHLKPGSSCSWERKYTLFTIDN
jgi:hypothetical protein